MRMATKAVEAAIGIALGLVALGLSRAREALAHDDAPKEDFGDDVPVRAHADDVANYTLHAVLDDATHVVHGDGTIVFRNTSNATLHELFLHLYLNAFKNERSVFLRAPVSSGRGTSPVGDWGYVDVTKLAWRDGSADASTDLWAGADKTTAGDADDQTDIRVPLPRPLAPGQSITLDVGWDAKLPSIVERTGHHGQFYMVAQWFPKLARLEPTGQWRHSPFHHLSEFYADFGTYDVTIDVPAGMVVGATGSRVSATTEKGRFVARYRQDDVHDFAWSASRDFREKTKVAEGVEIRVLFPPGYEAVADREMATAVFGLRYFGQRYGPYPYAVLTIVHPPAGAEEAGGMEYPTLITTGGAWYSPPFVHDIEAVTIHEFGHQYFYGLVASDEQTWPFLDEGVNSFAEIDAMRAMFGAGSGADFAGVEVSVASLLRLSTSAQHNEPVAQPAPAFASGADYGALVYARTAAILETAGRVYGEALLRRALGRYARRYRFSHPGYDAFVGELVGVLGEGAGKNLEVALRQKGWVDYLVASAASSRDDLPAGVFDRGGARETVTRGTPGAATYKGWALIMRHGTLELPVDIELLGADGTSQRSVWDGAGDWTRISYEGKSELARVVFDPDGKVTLDKNLLNNA
ncbi:MAG TPA: M1 family metallopeptidase, partial [Polyangiaceae bacterium]|nr:M1 family metallopeptidase [Polyangiaceae bacterium]